MIDWSFIRGMGWGVISAGAVLIFESSFVAPIHIAAACIVAGLLCLVFGYHALAKSIRGEDVNQ